MTTIAFKEDKVAVDGMSTIGSQISSTKIKKCFRLKDGSVACINGTLVEGMQIIAWLKADDGSAQPMGDADTSVVHFRPGNKIKFYECGGSFETVESLGAWGSGGSAAKGALLAGASVMDAVKIACEVDCYSGGVGTVYSVG